ncbi:hypothetical protein ACIPUC_14590 [Streptomyces sp. LARHCF249]
MSNSYGQAVLRTPDLEEALRAVHQLLALADTSGMDVTFLARVHTPQALERVGKILTEMSWWSEGADRSAPFDDSDNPAEHLPVLVKSFCLSPDAVEELLAAVGGGGSVVCWDFSSWPEAPEVGLGPGGERGAYVSLCVNARDLYLDEPSEDHTVYAHVKQHEAERAPWLAAQIGLQVFGELVMADD